MAAFPNSGDQRVSSSPAEYNLHQLLLDARTRWLKPTEICEILNNYHQLALSEASPVKPPSGSLFLFDRNKLRYFRKDGHNWRKKKDGRTVREAHEKLKAGNKDAIHCYYAHGEGNPSFQRRSYWLLEGGHENIVLVHYREVSEGCRLEASPSTFEGNPGPVYSEMQSAKMMYGSTEYLTPNLISSPSDVVSESYSQEGYVVDGDSGDEFGDNQGFRDRLSQAYQAQNNHGRHLVTPSADVMPHPLRSIGSASCHDVSSFQHELQFQTSAIQDPYGQGPSNKVLEDSTYPAGDNSANWMGLSQSQQLTVVKNLDFTTGSYNDQLATRDSGGYMGEHVGLNQSWSFKMENQPDVDYAGALRQELTTKTGVQSYMESNGLLMDPLKEKQAVLPNRQERQTSNNGLLSPTVSLFMQSAQSDLGDYRLETSWADFAKTHDPVLQVPSLPAKDLFPTDPEILFSILDFSPERSFAFEKSKVLVIGVLLNSSRDYSSTRWSCKFGEIEVPAEFVQPGILRCTTPLHEPGTVPFCVTGSDGVACSNIKEFEFQEKSTDSVRQTKSGEQAKQQEQAMLHQIRLAQFLLKREDRASDEEACDEHVTTKSQNIKLDSLVVDDNKWNQMEALVRSNQHPFEDAKVMLGQAFFKAALCQWLKRKANAESVTALDKHGLGVLHMVAALGYEWAILPLLAAGVGVNFRDERGWTALHWAAFCGREKVIALLLAAGAAPGALTDPTPNDSTGRTASDLAASNGHNGIAGYLGEAFVTSHFTSLNLSEMRKLSVAVARDQAIEAMSERTTVVDPSLGVTDNELSLRDSLAAVRNATKAEACIAATFRAYSFQRKREKEDSVFNEFGMLEEEARAFAAAQATSRSYPALEKSNLAATQIQCKYRGWKARSEFLFLKKHVVKIQAHVRGHQVRKKYKKILWTVGILEKVILRWRRKGSGLRGYKGEGVEDEDSDDDAYLKDFRKQKEAAFGEAVGRVKQMIKNPEARSQYRRMLEIYQKEKGAQVDEDLVIFDDDELMSLLG